VKRHIGDGITENGDDRTETGGDRTETPGPRQSTAPTAVIPSLQIMKAV
jgi:hypothetical protein